MRTFLMAIMLQAGAAVAAVASDVVPNTMWQRILDQGLTISLLGILAWLLWKRLKDLEDRLNKYMEEDRKTMMDVIAKNTQAFENVSSHLDKIK